MYAPVTQTPSIVFLYSWIQLSVFLGPRDVFADFIVCGPCAPHPPRSNHSLKLSRRFAGDKAITTTSITGPQRPRRWRSRQP
ncbi:hypothetical protein H4582DRAFT_1954925 [Lactarius indigo]|nr:hypothetical protein H4582DRAFT_1954925 [Lactarius indigo]